MRTIFAFFVVLLVLATFSESKKKYKKKTNKPKLQPQTQATLQQQTIAQKEQKFIESENDKETEHNLPEQQQIIRAQQKDQSQSAHSSMNTRDISENQQSQVQEVMKEKEENQDQLNQYQPQEDQDIVEEEEQYNKDEGPTQTNHVNDKTDPVVSDNQGQNDKEEQEEGQDQQKIETTEQGIDQENVETQAMQQVEEFQDTLAKTIDDLLKKIYSSMEHLTREFIKFVYHTKIFYKFINNMIVYHPQKIYYENNYASLNGGAKIIMKSSNKIKSINSILDDSVDKYMYTEEKLPIKIVIGLNQEIAIESITITSMEMYSSITKEFSVDGKFSMEDSKWVPLGFFTAQNQFGPQQFFTERKIVRYIRIKVRSAYGKWSYFTLTQVKIKGKGLFADAFAQLTRNQAEPNVQEHLQENEHDHENNATHHINFCENSFKVESEQPHESNLITSLMRKIQNLQDTNTGQSKTLQILEETMTKLTSQLDAKKEEAKVYKDISKKYEHQNGKLYYFILINTAISAITIISLICICLMRRKTLLPS